MMKYIIYKINDEFYSHIGHVQVKNIFSIVRTKVRKKALFPKNPSCTPNLTADALLTGSFINASIEYSDKSIDSKNSYSLCIPFGSF